MAYTMLNGKLVKTNKFTVKPNNHKGFAGVNVGKFIHELDAGGMYRFDAVTEADKMMQIVIDDPSPQCVYSSDRDLAQHNFRITDPGFFIAILPVNRIVNKTTGQIGIGFNGDPDYEVEARQVMDHFTNRWAIGEHHYAISSYCTWDQAQKHYKDIRKMFQFAVIGFSTPHNLQILSENPNCYGSDMVKVTI